MLDENCYVVSDETLEAVIIDCGAQLYEEQQALANYITLQKLKPVRLLCTHGHFDHNFGNAFIWKTYGLKPEVAAEDEGLMDIRRQMKTMLGTDLPVEQAPTGRLLSADDVIEFGSHRLDILPTPGHSRGSVTYYCEAEHVAFTGDTLFRLSIGRTDFEGGSWTEISHSLTQVLAKLPADTKVYPGHGEPTTIGEEVQYNPYMR
jgi:glyoxylase-like metal-dependent hydrolase (beta-lactamase superfamily II)